MVATIGRAVGLTGEVEVIVHSDDPTRMEPGSQLLVDADKRVLTVASCRRARGRLVVRFAELADRTGAEKLKGADLVVPASSVRTLGKDEFWDHDLIGCRVVTISGEEAGVVTDVVHGPSSDLLLLDGGRLVPLVERFIKSIDMAARVVTVDPIPGLLDDGYDISR